MPDNAKLVKRQSDKAESKANTRVVILISTFSDEESAVQVSRKVIELGYCACANLARVRSIYRWKGKIEDGQEVIVLFKTSIQAASKLKAKLAKIHPYEVPELLELDTRWSAAAYLNWIMSSTQRISKHRNNSS